MKPLFSILISLVFGLVIYSCKETANPTVVENLETSEDIRELYRPRFHFTPKANWMNDPNGMVYYNGQYHLFYQYYPDSTVWGPMHWGHARSKDLLHWEHRPIALYPDELGYIFSGSAVIDKENTAGFGKNAMIAIYTYHDPELEKEGSILFQTQGIAYSNDEGETWTKYKGNPVIPNPGVRDFRDPKVFWNQDKQKWQMVLVAKDHVQIYESEDLKAWHKLSDFRFEDKEKLGVWECPDLFKLPVENGEEEKWVLIISHGDGAPNGGSGTRYFIGDYDGTLFTTDQSESLWLDWGTDNYAGVTWNNEPNNRRIFIGWMSNWDYATSTPTEQWRSAMTLPRELSLHKNAGGYYLKNNAIPEFTDISSTPQKIAFDNENQITIKRTDLQQSSLRFNAELNSELQIILANKSGEKFVVMYNPETGIFSADRTKSGETGFNQKFINSSQQNIQIGKRDQLDFRLILDSCSIEIFINEGEFVLTNQIFPKEEYTELKIIPGKNSTINNLEIRSIKSVI